MSSIADFSVSGEALGRLVSPWTWTPALPWPPALPMCRSWANCAAPTGADVYVRLNRMDVGGMLSVHDLSGTLVLAGGLPQPA